MSDGDDWRTCAVCDKMDFVFKEGNYILFKYSTRRYAHAHCMVSKWGLDESEKRIRHDWIVKLFRKALSRKVTK